MHGSVKGRQPSPTDGKRLCLMQVEHKKETCYVKTWRFTPNRQGAPHTKHGAPERRHHAQLPPRKI